MTEAGQAAPGPAPEPPRVVIADDQALVRTGFRMILNESGIPVVAEAADGTGGRQLPSSSTAPTSC